jgi:mono/diheme cytochrome c family protein
VRALAAAPALAAAALLAAGCGTGGIAKGKADTTHGKQLFTEKCGSCHTLADAGTQGKIGPDLDDAFSGPRAQGFKESTIRNVVHGQILFAVEHPPGFIKGPNGEEQPAPGMPRDLVTGSDAEDVAAYVASVAGQGGFTEGGGFASLGTDGAKIFKGAGCAGCHTLSAAGATGTVGPNLDQLKPATDVVAHQVEVGGGKMPAFKDKLSDAQIQAVAQYVSSSAGK